MTDAAFDLWHQSPPPVVPRRAKRSRILHAAPPLNEANLSTAQEADAIDEELWCARVGRGRTRCHLNAALTNHAPPDEIALLQDAVERAEIRYQHARAWLIRFGTHT